MMKVHIWGLGFLVPGQGGSHRLDENIEHYFLEIAEGVDTLSVWLPRADEAQSIELPPQFRVRYYSTSRAGVITSGLRMLFRAWGSHILLYMPNATRIALFSLFYKAIAKSVAVYLADDPFAFQGKTRLSRIPLMDGFYRLLCRHYLSLPNLIISRGKYLETLARNYNDNVRITAPIIEVKPGSRRAPSDRKEAFTIVTMSRLSWVKGYQVLLDAYARLSDEVTDRVLQLVMAGDGPDKTAIVERVHEMGLSEHVQFPGWLSTESAKENLWAQADVHVLPTITTEGVPRCIDESILLGIPNIATSVGGIPAEYDLGEICLIPPKDVNALLEALKAIMNEEGRAALLNRAEARRRWLLEVGSAGKQHLLLLQESGRHGAEGVELGA